MLQNTCGCGPGVDWRQKTYDITKGGTQISSETLLLWSKEDLLLFFPVSCLTSQKVPLTTSAVRGVYTWSERLGPFCSDSPTGGGRASFIARQRPRQGCDATGPSSPHIYFSGRFPLGRRKSCGRRQRNGGCFKKKQKK